MGEAGGDGGFLLRTVLLLFLVAGRVCFAFVVDVLAFLAGGFLPGGMVDLEKNVIFV